MPFEFIILLRPWVNRGGLGDRGTLAILAVPVISTRIFRKKTESSRMEFGEKLLRNSRG